MTRLEWAKCGVISLTICFWILWNYWSNVVFGLLSPQFFAFISLPFPLPFFGMFALYDLLFAAGLWVVMYLSLFVVALLALALTLKGDRRYVYVSLAVLLFLTSLPLQMIVELSQSDLLISSLVVLSLVCERLKHRSTSAVLLSIATLLKGPAFLLLIYFVLYRRDWRYFAQFLVSTLLIVGASLLVVPIGLYWYYVVNVARTLSTGNAVWENQSIVGLMSLAGMSKMAPFVSLVGFGLFAFFAFWVSSKRVIIGQSALRADGMFLMNVLIMLLFGSKSMLYPYVWVILPLALFFSALLMEQVKMKYLALVSFAMFLLNSVYSLNGWYFGYQLNVRLPTILMGNLMMTLSLILIFIRPSTFFRSAKN